jgi:hypothetical protein
VRSADQIHVVFLEESRNYVGPKCEGYASVVFAPASDVFVGVRPQKVAEQTAVGNLFMLAKDEIKTERCVDGSDELPACGIPSDSAERVWHLRLLDALRGVSAP